MLADALRAFASRGGGDLKAMIALLADMPDGVSDIGNADKLAAKMADELKAAVATNPLLKATGPVLDPKLLYYGPNPGKTRISVINLSGLPSDDAKEDFINRLQMTLFGWVKKNPSPRGMLYVIDEAQIFMPSGAGSLSKTSGVQLVAQARKYGLGMIMVTQAPKGIDNKAISNCTTQFLGKQNSPTDQQSVKSMVAATGGSADDIGKLAAGEFYFKTERVASRSKSKRRFVSPTIHTIRQRQKKLSSGRGNLPRPTDNLAARCEISSVRLLIPEWLHKADLRCSRLPRLCDEWIALNSDAILLETFFKAPKGRRAPV